MAIFEKLCEDLPREAWEALRREVSEYALSLEHEGIRSELLAVDLALQIRDRLNLLLDLAGQLGTEERALIVGAARYFTSKDDAIPDARPCTGLDDDVRIVNHVLEKLGRIEWLIEE